MQEIDANVIKKQRLLASPIERRDAVNDSSQNEAQMADNIVTDKKMAIEPSHITSRSTASSTITSTTLHTAPTVSTLNVPPDANELSIENVAEKNDPTLKASVLLMQSINEQKQQHERNKTKASIKSVFSSVFVSRAGSLSRRTKNLTPAKTKKLAKKATPAVKKEPTKIDKTHELARGDIPGTSLRIVFYLFSFFS